MEIFLTKQCESFTGSLGKGFGYHIQRRTNLDGKTRFWGVRQSNGEIPADGHLRFIFACADLAQMKTHITDIRVPRCEFQSALSEAGVSLSGARDIRHESSATDVLTLKEKLSL